MFKSVLSTLRGGATEPTLKKLRNRLLAVNLISLTLVVIVAFSLVYIDSYNRVQKEIGETLVSIPPGVIENVIMSRQIVVAAGPSPASSGYESVVVSGGPSLPVDYSKSFVANIDEEGSITVFSMLDIENNDYAYAVTTAVENGEPSGSLNMAGRAWRYNMRQAPELPQGAFVAYQKSIVFLDVEEATRGLRALALTLFLLGIVAVGAILLISLFVANRAIRPVEENMARQRRFVADASHELKTPIAVIAANAEAAKAIAYDAENHIVCDGEGLAGASLWIDNISDEANRMGDLVKNLLALAKAEETRVVNAPFDLLETTREESDRVEAFLFEKNIAFIFTPPSTQEEPLFVNSDQAKLKTVLSVLFENAIKYTPDGGSVTILAGRIKGADPSVLLNKGITKRLKNGVYISVANTGEYIPPEDISHVFDRFFRADRSRNSETGGHGIGLSIAKEISGALGGELTVSSIPRVDGGAVNTFTLYI